uniref:Uncharacterized protein n=1 Tax=Micrurus surinamensis TaxID=129470 RepID=A0A2D4P6U7_MICSU
MILSQVPRALGEGAGAAGLPWSVWGIQELRMMLSQAPRALGERVNQDGELPDCWGKYADSVNRFERAVKHYKAVYKSKCYCCCCLTSQTHSCKTQQYIYMVIGTLDSGS